MKYPRGHSQFLPVLLEGPYAYSFFNLNLYLLPHRWLRLQLSLTKDDCFFHFLFTRIVLYLACFIFKCPTQTLNWFPKACCINNKIKIHRTICPSPRLGSNCPISFLESMAKELLRN
jgi:hypothetical protein